MELYQLETFLAVVEEKSFSRAAHRLHRTQSAVSQTINKLEEELGEKLFDRSSRDGSLTDAGQLLASYAEELHNLREKAHDALLELRQLHQGKLALAANEFTVLYLLPILSRFHKMHPTIKIEVSRALASQIPSQVLRHNVEFGILSFEPEDEQLDSVVFYKDDLVFVVYPSHPLARVRKATIRDLGAESFAAHIVLSPYRTKVIQAFKAHHTPLHMNVELPTLESIRSFVRMGQGVALVPRISVENDLRRGDLVDVAVQELRFERKMRIIMRSGATLSHAGSAFLKLCAEMANAEKGRFFYEVSRKRSRSARA